MGKDGVGKAPEVVAEETSATVEGRVLEAGMTGVARVERRLNSHRIGDRCRMGTVVVVKADTRYLDQRIVDGDWNGLEARSES